MQIAALLLVGLALAGSASATCWCSDVLTDTVPTSGRTCADYSRCGLKEYSLPCYTFTSKQVVKYGTPIGTCTKYTKYSKTSLKAIANGCKASDNCKGFSLTYESGGANIVVCYWSSITQKAYKDLYDTRCMGIWEKDTTSEYCKPPVTPPPSTDYCTLIDSSKCPKDANGCDDIYPPSLYSAANDRCKQCMNSAAITDKRLCASCRTPTSMPASTVDPVNCLDCVLTAKAEDKAACPCCSTFYNNGKDNGGSEMRCLDCIRSHTTSDPYGKPGYVSRQCLTYCRLADPKYTIAWSGMSIATQCLDCVAHVDPVPDVTQVGKFCITEGNVNGQCNGGQTCSTSPVFKPYTL